MTCAFPLKGNCGARGCFRKRLGNSECDHEEFIQRNTTHAIIPPKQKQVKKIKSEKQSKPLEIPDEIDEALLENIPTETEGRLIVCIGNKGYFNLK